MNDEVLCVIKFFALIVLIVLFIVSIIELIYRIKDRRFKKKYPEWIAFVEEYNSKIHKQCEWYNQNVSPLKRKIDNLEKSKEYLPKLECEKIDLEIEELKEQYFRLKQEDDLMNKELRDMWQITGKEIAEKENYNGYIQ